MKTPSDELFKLIRSLTPNEKRHFKLSVIDAGEKSYMKLFDLIDSQESYNEALIVQQLKNHPIVRNLKKWKTYISEVILRSLEAFHRDDDPESIIERELQRSRILHNKGLLHQSEQHLKKARKLIALSENYEYLPSLNKLDYLNLIAEPQPAKAQAQFRNEVTKDSNRINSIKTSMEYRELLFRIMPFALDAKTDSLKKNDDYIIKFTHHPLMISGPKDNSFICQHYYHLIRNILLSIQKKWTKNDCIKQKKWITHIESDKTKLYERSSYYLNAINYMIITLAKTGEIGKIEHYFLKFLHFVQRLPLKKRNRESRALISSIINNYIHVQLMEFNAHKAIEAWDYMQKIGGHLERSQYANILLYFNLIYAYFLSEDYHKALYFANKISSDKIFVNKRNQARLNIFLLMIHYELGNYEVLNYMARSTQRYLVKSGTCSEYDKLILNYFERKLSRLVDKKEEVQLFSVWKRELSKLSKRSSLYLDSNSLFNFSDWLDNKIERRTLAEIMKRKAMQAKR